MKTHLVLTGFLVLLLVHSSWQQDCGAGEFECADGGCIEGNLACNGAADCEDESDENGCTDCYSCNYAMRDGEAWQGEREGCEVPDADTPTVTCPGSCNVDYGRATQFGEPTQGVTRGCIPHEQCEEGLLPDPEGVPVQGIDNLVRMRQCCTGDQCIPACAADEFTCSNGQCVPDNQECNGVENCFDGSDEQECPNRCFACMYRIFEDDEEESEGSITECASPSPGNADIQAVCEGECFVQYTRHEGYYTIARNCFASDPREPEECVDGEDLVQDIVTTRECCSGNLCNNQDRRRECDPDTEYTCTNGQCIAIESLCDQTTDCSDGSDEAGCTECYMCEYGLRNGELLDGDPESCGNPSEGDVETFTCPGQCHVDFGRALVLGQPSIGLLRGCVSHASGGCEDGPAPDPERVGPPDLTIEDRETVRQCCEGPLCESVCNSETQFTCANSQCIAQGATCDGTADCFDGSDETDSLCADDTDDSGHMLKPSFSLQVLMAASAIGLVINALLHI